MSELSQCVLAMGVYFALVGVITYLQVRVPKPRRKTYLETMALATDDD